MRKHGGGSQLSQEGVALAREVGASMGPFVCVVTSVVPRARETAVAMGFAVDHELVTLASEPDIYAEAAAVERTAHASPFEALASIIAAEAARVLEGESDPANRRHVTEQLASIPPP
jgi:broad specificity phosphatase PhoE